MFTLCPQYQDTRMLIQRPQSLGWWMSVAFMFIRFKAITSINKIFYNNSNNINSNHLLEWARIPDQHIWSRVPQGTEKLKEAAVTQKKH